MIFQKKFIVIFALLLLNVHAQVGEILTGLSLNPDLVKRTNCALNDIKFLLGQYDCKYLNRQATSFNSFWVSMDFKKYQLYGSIKSFMGLLKQIKAQLAPNNVVVGVGNAVTGVKNFVIGNYDSVSGDNDWIIASGYSSTATSQLHEVLVIGNYQINLDLIEQMILDPSKVVECLNYQSKQAYFSSFGFAPSPSNLHKTMGGLTMMSTSFLTPEPIPVLSNFNWFGGSPYAKILC